MLKRLVLGFLFGGCVILLASCAAKNESKDEPPDKDAQVAMETPAKPDPREITVHVDGMTEQLALI